MTDCKTPRFRVGRHQPNNLYRCVGTGTHLDDTRFGFTIRDEDGPLVAAALGAVLDTFPSGTLAGAIACEAIAAQLGVSGVANKDGPEPHRVEVPRNG